MRLLIVEDEAVTALHLTMEFTRRGYAVSSVSRGEDAVRHLDRQRPDAVLMDINLGGGMDGIETAIALKGRGAHRVVFMSGYEKERLQKRIGRDYSPTALLFPKPIRMSDIDELDRVFREGA